MGQVILDNENPMSLMESENTVGLMGENILGSGSTGSCKGSEYSLGKTKNDSKATGNKEKNMELDTRLLQITKSLKGTGLMANL